MQPLVWGGIHMPKFRVWVSTDKVGSKCEYVHEIDDEDFQSMSEDDVEREMQEVMFSMINWSFEPID